MRRTLVLIPHEVAGLPVFGFGWMLILVGLMFCIRMAIAWRHHRDGGPPISHVLASEGLVWVIAAVAVTYVLPMVELTNLDGQPVGMAIRGYGVMLLIGVSAAVAMAAYRAKRAGIKPDIIWAIAPWAFFGGIIGARTFFVIQYRDQFVADSFVQTVANILRFTEGGLVVYGSFLGGFAAVAYYMIRHRLPLLTLGDVIIPCVFVGVFFGRIGCLMNGCCYGGRCEEGWMAVHFPAGSPVYHDQIRSGELLGMTVDPKTRMIQRVEPGSLADQGGIPVGGHVDSIADDLTPLETAPRDIPREEARTGVVVTVDGRRYRWPPDALPPRALPVYPAQLFSSSAALLLCVALLGLSMLNLRPGTVMLAGFAGYAVIRFGLEWIRVDEAGQFGTSFSISQWVSMVVFVVSLAGLWWIYRNPHDESDFGARSSAPSST